MQHVHVQTVIKNSIIIKVKLKQCSVIQKRLNDVELSTNLVSMTAMWYGDRALWCVFVSSVWKNVRVLWKASHIFVGQEAAFGKYLHLQSAELGVTRQFWINRCIIAKYYPTTKQLAHLADTHYEVYVINCMYVTHSYQGLMAQTS